MERITDLAGWIAGAATMYWMLGAGALAAVWTAAWLVRFAGRMAVSPARG
jgi:hypothetical protein